MKQIIKNILANKSLTSFILGAVIVILFLGQCNRINNLQVELDQVERVADRNLDNYLAARDTIRSERNANQELVSTIRSYEYEVGALNENVKQWIKAYQKTLAINKEYEKINNLISAELQIKDSIIANGSITKNEDTLTVSIADKKDWDKYNWRSFNGTVNILKYNDSTYSLLNSNFALNQGISLKMAIVENDGTSMLKVSSPYPDLEFTNIENINLVNDKLNEPRVNKGGWSIGLGVGYGLNIQGSTVGFGPNVSLGLYYSPKWLRF